MLEKIRVQGFKCFECEELTLKNLNLFTGINSAGKSSMIQAILLLMQQKENIQNPLNGKYVRLGLLQDVKNTVTNAKKVKISVDTEYINFRYFPDLQGAVLVIEWKIMR